MIELPDFSKAFEYENNFYLSCSITRISKLISDYEFYKRVSNLPGAIVECGVFKGASLARFVMFREIFGNRYSRKIIGFDTFEKFPDTQYEDDKNARKRFIEEAGENSISTKQLYEVLENKGIHEFVELVEGDIVKTVPQYLQTHPELKISILNLDTDLYEPAVTILENLYPRIVQGGVLILDDYGTFPGETKAVDEYFKDKNVTIQKFDFSMTPCYIIKD